MCIRDRNNIKYRNRFTKIYAEYNNLELYIFSNNNNSIFYYSKFYNTFCTKKDKHDRKLKECRVGKRNIVSRRRRTSKKLSENAELKNLDIIWSSSYTRAKATAKYIANVNNLPFNLDSNLSERKLGNLKELGKFMKDKSTRDPSQEQLLDRTFRTSDV